MKIIRARVRSGQMELAEPIQLREGAESLVIVENADILRDSADKPSTASDLVELSGLASPEDVDAMLDYLHQIRTITPVE